MSRGRRLRTALERWTRGDAQIVDVPRALDRDLAAALIEARTVADVSRIAVARAHSLYGASVARVAVRDERDVFNYIADSGPSYLRDEHASFSLHGTDPAAVVMRTERSAYWPSYDEFLRAHPRSGAILRPLGLESIAVLGLVAEDEPIGVWVVGFRTRRDFGVAERDALALAAVEVSVALERARLFEFERSVATTLQRSLLPPPSFIDGAGHCSRYIPAESSLAVGGDWYDTMRLSRGRIGLAVGDAVGRGLRAATVMGQLRSALGACALRARDAADTVDCLDEFAADLPEATSTTVAYAIVDPVGETIEYCSAGHPPPLCVSPDGTAVFHEDAQMWPLGVAVARTRIGRTARFPSGSLVVMYSDGLVERRRQSLDIGMARLAAAVVERVNLPIDQLADEVLVSMLSDSDGNDDVVLLVLRSPVCAPSVFLRKTTATPDSLASLRRDVRSWLSIADVPREVANDLLIAVGEACMNVVQHAYTDELYQLVRVEGARTNGHVMLAISDTGTWKEQSAHSVGGRGLDIMRQLVQSVEVKHRMSGTSVILRQRIEADHDATLVLH
jgi:serine phosphatase RsbU (regulator of sigma subunit)/anti-sigma regulatory factor (Ser/Thr protein kinase)